MTTGFWVLYYSFVASSIHYVFIVSRREDLNRKTLPVSLNSWICLPQSLMWLKIKQCSYFHFQEHFALCGNAAKTKYCSRGYLQQATATSMCIQLCLICGGQNSLVSFTLDFFFFKENISGHTYLIFILNIFWFLSNFPLSCIPASRYLSPDGRDVWRISALIGRLANITVLFIWSFPSSSKKLPQAAWEKILFPLLPNSTYNSKFKVQSELGYLYIVHISIQIELWIK